MSPQTSALRISDAGIGTECVVCLSNPSGVGTTRLEMFDQRFHLDFSDKASKCDIFIFHRTIFKHLGPGRTRISVDLEESHFRTLVLLLKYKDIALPSAAIYRKAWEGSIHFDELADPGRAGQSLIQAIRKLRSTFEDISGFDIPRAHAITRGSSYTLRGDFSFCVVYAKADDARYTI